ncbi:MAG: putative cathepsin B2 cysteine protease, partial [Streblomastix strix]
MFSLLLIAAVFAESIPEMINSNPNSTWVAKEYPPEVMNKVKFHKSLGLKLTPHRSVPYKDNNELPTEFDSREQWPDLMTPVRDQA